MSVSVTLVTENPDVYIQHCKVLEIFENRNNLFSFSIQISSFLKDID